MKSVVNFIVLLFVFNSCFVMAQSNYVANVKYELSVIGDFEFGLINNIDIGEDNKIYVNDLLLGILVFDDYGKLLMNYKSEGQGPGDFISIEDILVFNDKLYTLDPDLFRVSVFSRHSLEYQDSYELPPINNNDGFILAPSKLWRLSDGNFIVEYRGNYNRENLNRDHLRQYVLTDSLFSLLDESLFESKDREMLTYSEGSEFLVSMHPFGRDELVDIAPDGTVFKIWTEQNCIQSFSTNRTRKVQEICFDELTKKGISETDKNDMNKSEDSDLYKKVNMPDSYPYAEELIVDSFDSNTILWITKRNSDGITEVLEIKPKSKDVLRRINAGPSFKLMYAKDGILYGINRIDPITGYQAPKIILVKAR
ncbi:MAG TPA: 6-bladed beta-propeller [Bacteroidales bacterium]|nr:6-bladed beta-propeller [Bacteroidales bacterium]